MNNYILDGHVAVECPDLMVWEKWFEANKNKWHVADETVGNSRVSTVFLAIDHSFGEGPPILFETMVFGGPLSYEQNRCTTWEEAEVMHAAMCEQVKEVLRTAAAQESGDVSAGHTRLVAPDPAQAAATENCVINRAAGAQPRSKER